MYNTLINEGRYTPLGIHANSMLALLPSKVFQVDPSSDVWAMQDIGSFYFFLMVYD